MSKYSQVKLELRVSIEPNDLFRTLIDSDVSNCGIRLFLIQLVQKSFIQKQTRHFYPIPHIPQIGTGVLRAFCMVIYFSSLFGRTQSTAICNIAVSHDGEPQPQQMCDTECLHCSLSEDFRVICNLTALCKCNTIIKILCSTLYQILSNRLLLTVRIVRNLKKLMKCIFDESCLCISV